MIKFIQPDWPAPANVNAYMTTRHGDISALHLPEKPRLLTQVHGIKVIPAEQIISQLEGDASYTQQPGIVCAIRTADCLPVLICNRQGTEIAAIHAGWRGLAAGIIEKTIQALASNTNDLLVWLGPAIGPNAFEVGSEVYEQFIAVDHNATNAFQPSKNKDHWLANIYQLARQRLNRCGVTAIYGGNFCTYSDPDNFFSYRRDNVTGRMLSLIWLNVT